MLLTVGLLHSIPILIAIAAPGTLPIDELLVIFGIPSIVYAVLASLLDYANSWSLITALTLASLETLLLLAITFVVTVCAYIDYRNLLIPLLLFVTADVLMMTLLVLLVRLFAAFRVHRNAGINGFEVVQPSVVIPIEQPSH